MPNGRTHRAVGTACGVLTAAVRARPEDGESNLLVMMGSGVGAYITARWPDLLEPATCPRHRQVAHSVAVGGGLLSYAVRAVPGWEAHWRSVAVEARNTRLQPGTAPSDQLLLLAIELVAWLLVGVLAGMAAGYVSHLVLDGCTPAGLPLLGLCAESSVVSW
jgi:membrane-bound metal-dependent hydrolase YbcI (DUF457 family)